MSQVHVLQILLGEQIVYKTKVTNGKRSTPTAYMWLQYSSVFDVHVSIHVCTIIIIMYSGLFWGPTFSQIAQTKHFADSIFEDRGLNDHTPTVKRSFNTTFLRFKVNPLKPRTFSASKTTHYTVSGFECIRFSDIQRVNITCTYRTGRKFRGGLISRFSWVADDTKIIHVEGGINTRENF